MVLVWVCVLGLGLCVDDWVMFMGRGLRVRQGMCEDVG